MLGGRAGGVGRWDTNSPHGLPQHPCKRDSQFGSNPQRCKSAHSIIPQDASSGCPATSVMVPPVPVCHASEEVSCHGWTCALGRFARGLLSWFLETFSFSEKLQCPPLVRPVAGREAAEPAPTGAAPGGAGVLARVELDIQFMPKSCSVF